MPASSADLEATAFVCPMHPDYTVDIEGRCPRCGMALVRATPYDVRDYGFELTTVPAVIRPGQQANWRFKVFHPGTGQQIMKFEAVHEKQYHLFVISQDMEHFQHIHPEQLADGTWTLDVTLPKPGYYKVLSDFLPSGGSSQLIARPIVTAGYTGDLVEDSAVLVPDVNGTKTVDDITASVSYDPPSVRCRSLRASHLQLDGHDDRTADNGSANVPGRVRTHADHERGHGGLRARASTRHPRQQRR